MGESVSELLSGRAPHAISPSELVSALVSELVIQLVGERPRAPRLLLSANWRVIGQN